MQLNNDSLTIVILGDWNKLYIQPDWIANNVFEAEEMEIGLEGQGSDIHVSYKFGNINIRALQEKIIFSASNMDSTTLSELSKSVNNFIEKAHTPKITAYGINVDYTETQDTKLAAIFDTMGDSSAIIDLNYEIVATKINRTLKKDGKIINLSGLVDGQLTKFHFNEHYESPNKQEIVFSDIIINEFINRTKEIVEKLGYELAEDDK